MNDNNNLTPTPTQEKIEGEPRVWLDIHHKTANRFAGKYCPQTGELKLLLNGKWDKVVLSEL